MRKRILLMMPIFLLVLHTSAQANEHCGNVTFLNTEVFELPSPNTPQRAQLNQTVLFKLGVQPYSFHLTDDENLLIYHYMLKMIDKAKNNKTPVGVRYRTLESGERKITSMAFCKEDENCNTNCFID